MSFNDLDRRGFLFAGTSCAMGAGLLSLPSAAQAQPTPESESAGPLADFPQQAATLVRDVVGASHARFDRVRELVEAMPELAKASWDWGFGDWESAIEAASHTGNREIALYLIAHGARPNLFTWAMLGNLPAVKAMLEAQPELRSATGPHGLSLHHHAVQGDEQAKPVLEYLESIGIGQPAPTPIPPEQQQAILGHYVTSVTPAATFELFEAKQGLSFKGADGSPRRLTYLSDGSFHPVGAPSVRFQFEVTNGRATTGTVRFGGQTVRFSRQG